MRKMCHNTGSKIGFLLAAVMTSSAVFMAGCGKTAAESPDVVDTLDTGSVTESASAESTSAESGNTESSGESTSGSGNEQKEARTLSFTDEEKQRGVNTPFVKIDGCQTRELIAVNLGGDSGAQTKVTATDQNGNEIKKGVFLSWRAYAEDLDDKNQAVTMYAVYRNGEKIGDDLKVTNCVDEEGSAGDIYRVVGSNDALLGVSAQDTKVWSNQYMEFQLNKPEDSRITEKNTFFYTANDMSLGDLDGDGSLDLVVKWYPSNAKDNSQEGVTGPTFLDGYKMDFRTGEAALLWRIDLGINIRSGAHYTQFQVWDYDGDGIAEIAMKTADGTTAYRMVDGELVQTGHVGTVDDTVQELWPINKENSDYRSSKGYVLNGPEYFTMFDGTTGEIIDTVDYIPERGKVGYWGDSYGNRVDRFLAGTAYLDGEKPYAVFGRGYYTRTCLTAYYLEKKSDGSRKIETFWTFDTDEAGNEYKGQGNHSLAVNDVDGDGKDEIIYGSLVVDNDGSVLYTTGLGHGDADHVSDWIPSRPGLEYMGVHEDKSAAYHVEIHDAATGEMITGYYTGKDTGRGMASDVDPRYEGAEYWSVANPNYTGDGEPSWNNMKANVYSSLSGLYDRNDINGDNMIVVHENGDPPSNFSIYWDGDLLAEMQDHTFDSKAYVPLTTTILKWDYENGVSVKLLESDEIYTSNGTKGNLGLVGDFLGDWREEVIARCADDDSKIRVYTTTIQTDYVIPCLMTNLAYREGIAWQNTAYNQPAHTSFLISEGVITAKLSSGVVDSKKAEIRFTAASDGTRYGHAIEGYIIERGNVAADGSVSSYNQVAAIENRDLNGSESSYLYVDENIKSGATYSYKISAIVDGKKSYSSLPLSVSIP